MRIEIPTHISRKQERLLLLLLAALILTVYSHTLRGPFVYDDALNILDNKYIRITDLTMEGIMSAGFDGPSGRRPVSNISFALNYFFHKYDVFGYHIVNIFIHLLTTVLFYYFVKITLRVLSYPRPVLTAFAAALIWCVNPVHTQSVTYVVQRMNSMAAMFYILSILLYVKGRVLMIGSRSSSGEKGEIYVKQYRLPVLCFSRWKAIQASGSILYRLRNIRFSRAWIKGERGYSFGLYFFV